MPPGIYEALQCTCTDLNDWPPQYQDGYIIGNVSTVANAYIAFAAGKVAQMATWLGKHQEATYYQSVSDRILMNLRARLYNATEGSFSDGLEGATTQELTPIQHGSMQATLFPLMAGVVNETAIPGMGLKMVGWLKKTGMKCSCMAAYWLLQGLYKTGVHYAEAADHALEVMRSTGMNSWTNMLQQGATCTMESWPDGTKPGSVPDQTWSHPWCSGPNSNIIRFLLGVRPIDLGWARMLIMPQPSSLMSVNGSVPVLVQGVPATVEVQLVQSRTTFEMSVTIPEGSGARVCIPPAQGMASGDAKVLSLDGIVVAAVEAEGRMLCFATDIAPGVHIVSRY